MKFLLSILSISLLSTMWLGPGIAGGAQLLSDDDLDQVTAAGTTWSVDILPTNLVLGTTPTTNLVQPITPLTSALEAVKAAQASAASAAAVPGIASLAVASGAVLTAATALDTAFQANGIESLTAGRSALSAAADLLNSLPLEQHTNPVVIDAANKVNLAATSLNQTAIDAKAVELTSAVDAVTVANAAIQNILNNNGSANVGGDADHSQAINEAVKSIQVAKDALDAASQAQAVSTGGSQTFVLKENGDGSLDPVLRINFSSGKTVGSADIIPLVTRGGPSQPGLDALNLDGAAIVNGTLPLTLIAETLMMNLNVCYACVVYPGGTLIQDNNGYVIPIYTQ